MKKLLLFFSVVLSSHLSHGKVFSNSFISFQLPPNWSCKTSSTEWVCRSSNNEQAKQAIIVFTAKQVGPNDNFAYYNQYLKTPKTPKHRDGTVATSSKVQHLKIVKIANHPWIDSLHLGSLLPNFYSRYLVTVKGKVAVLITFSAKKEFYAVYSRHFFNAINSLKANVASQSYSGTPGYAIDNPDGEDIDSDMVNQNQQWNEGDEISTNTKGKNSNMLLYGIALLLVGAASFFLIRRK